MTTRLAGLYRAAIEADVARQASMQTWAAR